MKKRVLSLALALLMVAAPLIAPSAQAAPPAGSIIQDPNFYAAVLTEIAQPDGYVITAADVASITSLNVGMSAIKDLAGIEHFTALEWLDCSGNQLTALDVSSNTKLTYLSCSGNELTALDVSKNTALEGLDCSDNQLTALDVSSNTKLTYLDCYGNELTALDVSKNTALEGLDCYDNQLTALDVSKNTALEGLDCSGNQLTALDVSKNTALTYLYCDDNELTALDVSSNTKLKALSCYDNKLTALDVSKNTALEELYCKGNQLTALDVSKNTALEWLSCYDNQLTALDVSSNTKLTYLDCSGNELTALDVSKNTALEWLSCYDNQLTALDVTGLPLTDYLDCSYNNMTNKSAVKGFTGTWGATDEWGNIIYTYDPQNVSQEPDEPDEPDPTPPDPTPPDPTPPDPTTTPEPTPPTPTTTPATTPTPEPATDVFVVEDGEATATHETLSELTGGGEKAAEVVIGGVTILLDADAVSAILDAGDGDVVISVKELDGADIPGAYKDIVGGRPVYDLAVTVGGAEVSYFNGGKVSVSIPYEPGNGEDVNALVVYYLDADGAMNIVHGVYDASKGAVVFTTKHFSVYAIGYNMPAYTDIDGNWAKDAIVFIGAREIPAGIDAALFDPSKQVTRGEFTAALMRAYGIGLDKSATDNFADADAGAAYAPYLATAKKLGIIKGKGGNSFAPELSMTRTEMFVLLYNVLDAIGEAPKAVSGGKRLSDFADAGQVGQWAVPVVETLISAGILEGDGTGINPKKTSSRAEMAVLIKKLLTP